MIPKTPTRTPLFGENGVMDNFDPGDVAIADARFPGAYPGSPNLAKKLDFLQGLRADRQQGNSYSIHVR
jgi:hypothetical protein